jgi:peptidoglycan/xylan/chitin deacetylase (PgdA/CDA1 family)
MKPGISARIFLSAAQRRALQGGVGIYVFHKIAPPPRGTRDPFEYTPAEALRRKLAALIEVCDAGMTLDTLANSPGQCHESFAVTFDDGYRNTVENALPVLCQLGLKATLYVVAGKIGGENSWDQAKGEVREELAGKNLLAEWLATGHGLGSHSLTHPNLRKISPTQAREEIFSSKKLLEDTFGISVRHFCYPYGSLNAQIRDCVAEAGYATAATVEFGFASPGKSLFELPRIPALTAGEWIRKAMHRARRKFAFAR